MLEQNKLYDQLDLTRSFSTFSYPELSHPKEGGLVLADKFVQSIDRHIIGDLHSEYALMNQALYTLLMGKHKVLLGEMPEILYRQILVNSFSLGQMKDMFKFVLDNIVKFRCGISFREAAINFLPHIFQSPKDLYMTAILKEAFQASVSLVALIGSEHTKGVSEYWQPPPFGINFTEATRIPDRLNEPEEDTIEKHALLDSLLEKRPWGAKFIQNPFPYLVEDISKVPPEKLQKYIKCFQFHFAKYETFKQDAFKLPQIQPYKKRFLEIVANEPFSLSPGDRPTLKQELEQILSMDMYDTMPVLEPRTRQAPKKELPE